MLVTNGEISFGEHSEHPQIIDLVHEALMEGWKDFVEWREKYRELLGLRDRLEDTLRVWNANGRKDEDLMMRGLLARVIENWQDLQSELDVMAQEFYRRSDDYEREQASAQKNLRDNLLEIQAKLEELSRQQAEIENQKADFQVALQRFEKRIGNSQRAAQWLKENQAILVETATEAALNKDSSLTQLGGPANSLDKNQRFRWDIEEYIDWLCSCLELGAIIPLEETDLIPTLRASAYAEAFDFIKRERIAKDLPEGVAEELKGIFSYLINYFSAVPSE
ncbi:MAG: hypothetical protein PUP92_32545 [Rhizonema sp. PD38]|nr:hypothetical protein [Rhizonema sp. PD38]